MSLTEYMPTDDQSKAVLFLQFAANIGAQLTALNLQATDPDIVQQALDATRFRALVDFGVTMQSASQSWTANKNHERDGGDVTPSTVTLPVLPPNFPAAVPPGIVPRFRALAKRVKACSGYTIGIGEMLGIERAQGQVASVMATDGPTPVLRGKALDTGGAELKSNKGDAEAVDLYCKRDTDADFVRLDRVLHFPYIDSRPLLVAGKPEKREYRAKFIRQNQPYGNMSASITIIVSA